MNHAGQHRPLALHCRMKHQMPGASLTSIVISDKFMKGHTKRHAPKCTQLDFAEIRYLG
jgi:hypothetical protein